MVEVAHSGGGRSDRRHIIVVIQLYATETLAYTPGLSCLEQPTPHDTIPTSTYRVVGTDDDDDDEEEGNGNSKGPAESPSHESVS